MRIFYSTGMFSEKYGALERMFVVLSRKLSEKRVEIVFQFEELPKSRVFLEDVREAGAKIVVIRTRGRVIKGFFDIFGVLRSNDFDVVHATFSPAKDLSVLAGRMAGVPRILSHYRNIATDKPRTGLRLWLTSRFSDVNIAVSEAVKTVLVKRGVPPERIKVVYNSISVPPEPGKTSKRLENPSGTPVVVMSAAWDDPVKGVDLLLEAFAIVAKEIPAVELWLAGEACNNPVFRRTAEEKGFGKRVRWLGVRDDIPLILEQCDIYVQPSRMEAFSSSILEAMVVEKPVVAFGVGGIPEVIKDGITGILAEPQNASSLAAGIMRLVKDPGLRQKMGKAGREQVRQFFDINKEIGKVMELYGIRE